MINWKITISKYKKASKEIPKAERRYSIAVGYMKKWEDMWTVATSKSFTFEVGFKDDERIKGKANILWSQHFKGQPKQVLIFLDGELKYGRDNLDKFMFR